MSAIHVLEYFFFEIRKKRRITRNKTEQIKKRSKAENACDELKTVTWSEYFDRFTIRPENSVKRS